MPRAIRTVGRFWWAAATAGAVAISTAGSPAVAAAGPGGFSPRPVYRAGDFARGQAMFILPPRGNGPGNAAQFPKVQATGQRPPPHQDPLPPAPEPGFGYPSLTDSALHNYYLDESFGVKRSHIIRTERPSPAVPVVIYRDTHDIPHVYGKTDPALAFGAGFAQAEDRLFLMDVLRHFGS